MASKITSAGDTLARALGEALAEMVADPDSLAAKVAMARVRHITARLAAEGARVDVRPGGLIRVKLGKLNPNYIFHVVMATALKPRKQA